MTKAEFIEEWKHCDVTESKVTEEQFEKDLDSVIKHEMSDFLNEYKHVTKCCECNKWIFFNDENIKTESIGGRIIRRLVWCKECKTDVPLYPWRTLTQ